MPSSTEESDASGADARQVLAYLSVGLMRQDNAIRAGTSQPVTKLEAFLQWGWDRLAALCYSFQVPPPRHVPDLVEWLHTPVEEWKGIGSFFHDSDISGPLLTDGAPSELCTDLDRGISETLRPDIELEDAPFKEIYDLCKTARLGDGYDHAAQYTRARRFLVEHPYLPDEGVVRITLDQEWHPDIRKLLRRCYTPIPARCTRKEDGKMTRCPRCGWPLRWNTQGCSVASCYSDLCVRVSPDLHDPHEDAWETITPDAVCTTRGIQHYVVGPEIHLLDLYARLTRDYHLRCTLWPEVDAHDLTVWMTDDEPWALDLKDYRSSLDLAIKLSHKGFPLTNAWDGSRHRAFYIFPQHRRKLNPRYMAIFKERWVAPPDQRIDAVFDDEFLKMVERRLKGEAKGHA